MNPFKKGHDLIESTIGQFEKIKTNLAKGIEACKTKISENNEKISELSVDNTKQTTAVNKATKVMDNIDKFLLS